MLIVIVYYGAEKKARKKKAGAKAPAESSRKPKAYANALLI